MATVNDPYARTVLELRGEVARQRDAIADLREELRQLRAAIASEVTTQRLIVVDAGGRDRIVLDAATGAAVLALHAFGGVEDAEPTMVMQLTAVDPQGDAPARVSGGSFVAGNDACVRSFGVADECDGVVHVGAFIS